MKKIYLLFATFFFSMFFAQVGVGTDSPKANLHVMGNPSTNTVVDGVIPPRISGDQLKAKDGLYNEEQNGAIVYVTSAVTTSSTKTSLVNEQGLYFYDSTQGKWRKLITGVPLTVQAFNGQRTTDSGTIVSMGASKIIDLPTINISPTSDIGTWNSSSSIFTVNRKGVYTIYAGIAMINSSSSSTGAMTIRAGQSVTVGGSQRTVNTTASTYTVNCSGVFSGLLNVGEQIYVSATSGNVDWYQGKSFLHIAYSEI